MHCNLRPYDVAPVALGFNYEAHSAPAYKFNVSAPCLGFSNPGFPSDAVILATG